MDAQLRHLCLHSVADAPQVLVDDARDQPIGRQEVVENREHGVDLVQVPYIGTEVGASLVFKVGCQLIHINDGPRILIVQTQRERGIHTEVLVGVACTQPEHHVLIGKNAAQVIQSPDIRCCSALLQVGVSALQSADEGEVGLQVPGFLDLDRELESEEVLRPGNLIESQVGQAFADLQLQETQIKADRRSPETQVLDGLLLECCFLVTELVRQRRAEERHLDQELVVVVELSGHLAGVVELVGEIDGIIEIEDVLQVGLQCVGIGLGDIEH